MNANRSNIPAPNPRGRPLDDWTPSLIRLAFAQAETGSLRLAAELCDALRCDDRVQGCFLALRGLFGLKLEFEDGSGLRRRKAKRWLEADEDWWTICPEDQLSLLLMWGVLLGVGLAELRWSRVGKRWLPKLHVWDPRFLRWNHDEQKWFVETADGALVEVVPGGGKWVLFTPYGAERPWAGGAWRSIALWARLKRYAIADWGRYSEQAGGLKVGTTETGSENDRKKLASDLALSGQDTSVVLPKGWDLQLLTTPAESFKTFEGQVNAANTAFAIALLGQNLTTEVTGGSYAAANVHRDVSKDVLRMLSETLSTTLHVQQLQPWAKVNFGEDAAAPFPAWQIAPPANTNEEAAGLESLGRALGAFSAAGVEVDDALLKVLGDRFNVPLKKRAETPASATPPAPASMQTPPTNETPSN